ncbi:MAG: hypothetical protein J0M02_17785, partial [Planctomycetes bacterium]|nr:hypothetical protein [Planctomycetota bacterium]
AAPPRPVGGDDGEELAYPREARRLIDGAHERLWMAMYVIRVDDGPVGGLLQALADAAARGVDVRVCLDRGSGFDGEPDPKHESPAAWLSAHGVRVVLDEERRTTHAKVLIADGRRILSGSHNWTRSAFMSNRELSWLVEDPRAARRLEAWLGEVPGWHPGGP